MRQFEKGIMLESLDNHWKEHLAAMDYLRQGIGLRGYAQKNPKQEYKREAFAMFESLLDNIKHDVVKILTRVRVREDAPMDLPEHAPQPIEFTHQEFKGFGAESPVNAAPPEQPAEEQPAQPFVRDGRKIGRNEPCPCGSGKKYKQCHGKLT
jgi:preprotein translocase subunit SecA